MSGSGLMFDCAAACSLNTLFMPKSMADDTVDKSEVPVPILGPVPDGRDTTTIFWVGVLGMTLWVLGKDPGFDDETTFTIVGVFPSDDGSDCRIWGDMLMGWPGVCVARGWDDMTMNLGWDPTPGVRGNGDWCVIVGPADPGCCKMICGLAWKYIHNHINSINYSPKCNTQNK